MKIPSLRTAAMISVVILIMIGLLWMRSCQAEREAKRRAEITAKARDADAIAAAARQEDQANITADRQEITNVLEALPDVPLTDRQRARYCAVFVRQNPGTPCPAAR